jgi:hypothetical protein
MIKRLRNYRQLVGTDDMGDVPLAFARFAGATGYMVPAEIEVEDDSMPPRQVIVWADTPSVGESRLGPPTEGCLQDFLALAPLGQDDDWLDPRALEQVVAFVRQRGMLGLAPVPMSTELEKWRGERVKFREPVSFYSDLASLFQTLLQVAIDLRNQRVTFPLGNDVVSLLRHGPTPSSLPTSPKELQFDLEELLTHWMHCAYIHPAIFLDPQDQIWRRRLMLPSWRNVSRWDVANYGRLFDTITVYKRYRDFSDLPIADWRPSPLFAILIAQATALITSTPGLQQCPFCGGFYQPRRKPRADRRETCGQVRCQADAHNEMQNERNRRLRTPRPPKPQAKASAD